MIIVLGENILLAGATATDVGLTSSVVVALGVAFLSSVALWWLYFGREATSAVRRMAADEAPGRVGRDAYTYLHLPIVAGILLTAVGDQLVIAHPSDELGEPPWDCWRLGLLDSNPDGVGLLGSVEGCFELGGRDVAEVAVKPGGVVPVDPAEGGQLDVLDRPPRSLSGSTDQLGLVEPDHRLAGALSAKRPSVDCSEGRPT